MSYTHGILLATMLALASWGAEVVTYEQFGAKGDGKTDDLPAIVAAHAHANRKRLPVRARDEATYYIGGRNMTALVQTDTNLGKAHFILDDRQLENIKAPVFSITTSLKPFKPTGLTALTRNQQQVPVTFPHDCLVVVTDKNVRRYIRRGINRNQGSFQTDAFVVDRHGKVDMRAPIIWDFEHVTTCYAYPMDEQLLTFSGGVFTTLANQFQGSHRYVNRNIAVRRSNVLVRDVTHHVREEGTASFPYAGFLNIQTCANVTCENCLLTGHSVFRFKAPKGQATTTGTYDIIAARALNVTFRNCRQTNDYRDRKFWGIMGSNFCKNLTYDGCVLSRFDAHQGVANATIRNSHLGHQGVNAIGFGTLTLENTSIQSYSMINFRSDYGSSWRGKVVIRNCTFISTRSRQTILFGGNNDGAHDFGYVCHLPRVFDIDGLLIKDGHLDKDYPGPFWFGIFNWRKLKEPDCQERYPLIKPEVLKLRNIRTEQGKQVRICEDSSQFAGLRIITD